MKKVNWLAIIVTAVIQMGLSAFWYSIFTNPWMEGTGVTQQMAEENADYSMYAVAFIGFLVLNYIMSVLFQKMNIESLGQAVITTLMIWLGFFFFQESTHYLFAFKSWTLIMIDAGNTLVGFLVAAIILTLWKGKRS